MPTNPMKVEVWLEDTSDPILFDFAQSVYQKKDMFCIRCEDGHSEWFPMLRIFRVRLFDIE